MSWVYCIQAGEGGPVKIGTTGGKPEHRLKQLQTGNPATLRLVGAMHGGVEAETLFHEAFADCRLHGEWFSDHIAVRLAFAAVAQWGGGLPTCPPLTPEGRAALRDNFNFNGPRRRYPDGSLHSRQDWDELARMEFA